MERLSVLKEVDLCKLLKACRDTGVAELSLGDMHIVFGDVWPKTSSEVYGKGKNRVEFREEEPREISESQEKELRELQKEDLLITDPLAYEKMQELGEE